MTLNTQPLHPAARLAAVQEASGHVEPTPLLTVEQAAERLGTPTRFVRRLIAQRRIRFCRIGRYVRIAANDLAEFIEAGRVEPAASRRIAGEPGSSLHGTDQAG
jgi:excisionase family DNA binding protein